jgi:hypothetical protein
MPDPKQMSGIPRPVDDLPGGSVSVRLIRGELSNNITNHPVELHIGDKVQTAKTDEMGRAQFDKLPAGATLKAVAVVDGERLESQEFPAPSAGGIRLMLVATDKEKEARAASEANRPAITGQVVLGGETRVVIEPSDEAVRLYYMLDIENTARAPVNPPSLFMFDMPAGAIGTALLEDSSPKASVNGGRVRVQGPFPPGHTFVQAVCELPVGSGSLEITQRFPATLDHLGVLVKKVGDMRLSSPQVTRQQDMPAQGETFIAAAGGAIGAGQPLTLTLTGLPHHSKAPQRITLSIAAVIVLGGIWLATGRPSDDSSRAAERKRLMKRREQLFHDLVQLESEHRRGRGDRTRFAVRREQLLKALEQIYRTLDTDDIGPDAPDRPGVAA